MKDTSLKQLNGEKRRLENSIHEITQDLIQANNKLRDLKGKLTSVTKRIDGITSRTISVSEHAVLRYLERVEGYDLKEIRKKILTDEARATIETIGSGLVPVGDGIKLRVENRVIVTLFTDPDVQENCG